MSQSELICNDLKESLADYIRSLDRSQQIEVAKGLESFAAKVREGVDVESFAA